MLEEYRKSLKLPEAEELFDLAFYRPMAWLFVRAVHRTPITPNQVTLLSLASSFVAAYCFARGGFSWLAAGAAWYALANILDCADGQLARVQGSGTPNGRIVDGIADYVGTVAIFLGIGIGFNALGIHLWTLTVAAGLTSALHAILFDHRQNAFIAARRGDGDFHGREMEKHAPASAGVSGSPAGGVFSRLYVGYMRTQAKLVGRFLPPPGEAVRDQVDPAQDAQMIRLWSFLGPTTNRTALIAFALIGRIDLFLWAVIVPGNLWLAAMWYLQRRIDNPTAPPPGQPGGRP
jgi:hypothetical protein